MDVYFLRHGDAEDLRPGGSDAERRLTDKGLKQSARAAAWLRNHDVTVDVVVTSPLVRARQTAEPVARALEVDLREDARLSGGRLTVQALAALIADAGNPEAVLLVGHEPDFSMIIEELTGGAVEVKKAALVLVTCDRVTAGAGELAWLIPASLRS